MPETHELTDAAQTSVRMQWGVRIPLRDGVSLSATLYRPKYSADPRPCLFALTPYTVHRNHPKATYFAAHGYPCLVVDARGRGNSQGVFRPFIQEAQDGYDIVEWIATQPFCNGKVATFSGSYEGYSQWATAKEFPPHLSTIVPGMAAAPGIDFPMRNNIITPYVMQWLTFVAGHTSQERIFNDRPFWSRQFCEWHQSGRPFQELDAILGNPSTIFQEWVSHPIQDAYWDSFKPTGGDFAKIDLPMLTLTGSYDDDQLGALHYYREHLRTASPTATSKHYLVIGPWDHGGTLAPQPEFGGLKFGPEALVDILKLHLDWYDWIMRGGGKPRFLQKNVAYYVMGAEKWRYADTLESITSRSMALFLQSTVNPIDVFKSGSLVTESRSSGGPDHYVYDPRDVSLAELESAVDPEDFVDQRMIHASAGKLLIYHSAPFESDAEVSGFFSLSLWISIDEPDTDLRASIHDIHPDGSSIQLSVDWMRARYRESLREERLISTRAPLLYKFNRFTFVSRTIKKANRLRLVIGPLNSVYSQKNFNSGGVVSAESLNDARPVTVKVFHDALHPSVLYVPFGQQER